MFSFDLAVIGLMVGVLALRPSGGRRSLLAIAALCPLSAAALQLRFIGFIPPTGILLAVAGLTLLGAAVSPSAPAPAAPRLQPERP